MNHNFSSAIFIYLLTQDPNKLDYNKLLELMIQKQHEYDIEELHAETEKEINRENYYKRYQTLPLEYFQDEDIT